MEYQIRETEIQRIPWEGCGHRIYMKREDLIGFSFGGNKVRIALEFFRDMEEKGCDCMIAYGSSRSNMCRAVANLCSSRDVPCYIVTAREDVVREGTYNSRMVSWFGAETRLCSKDGVAPALEALMEELKTRGRRPYYIFGDSTGHGNEPAAARAYENVYREILSYEERERIRFDRIFLASGTGMTQGGLISGQLKYGGKAEIIGISVARPYSRGSREVARFAGKAGEDRIIFEDAYICGGYGKFDRDIEAVIERMMCVYGIPMDPTYTGKAYTGMLKWLAEREREPENILFIHTGGTPLYFDYIEAREGGRSFC